MTAIADLPDIRPSLLLDFANSGRVDPRIQCTRASSATCFGPDGKLRTVPANVPRIDYDPATGKCLGLLVEEARANLVSSSNNFGAGTWGKTRVSVTDPDVNGWTKVTEDTSEHNTHALNFNIPTTASTTYTLSVDVKTGTRNCVYLSFGNFANQVTPIGFFFNTETGLFYGGIEGRYTSKKLSDGWRLSVSTTTIAQTSGNITASISISQDIVYGSNIYTGDGSSYIFVRNVQVEVGAFPTSYIPTEGTAVTRASEQMCIPVVGLPASGFSYYSEQIAEWSAGEYVTIFSDSKTALGNYIGVRNAAGGAYINSTEGGRTPTLSQRPAAGQLFKVAASFSSSGASSLARDGASISGGVPQTVADLSMRKYLKFGTTGAAATLVARISKVSVYSGQLTLAQIQRLTA